MIRALRDLSMKSPENPDPEVAQTLESLLVDQDDGFTRKDAAKALETWAIKDNVPALIRVLEDESPWVRQSAMKALRGSRQRKRPSRSPRGSWISVTGRPPRSRSRTSARQPRRRSSNSWTARTNGRGGRRARSSRPSAQVSASPPWSRRRKLTRADSSSQPPRKRLRPSRCGSSRDRRA